MVPQISASQIYPSTLFTLRPILKVRNFSATPITWNWSFVAYSTGVCHWRERWVIITHKEDRPWQEIFCSCRYHHRQVSSLISRNSICLGHVLAKNEVLVDQENANVWVWMSVYAVDANDCDEWYGWICPKMKWIKSIWVKVQEQESAMWKRVYGPI